MGCLKCCALFSFVVLNSILLAMFFIQGTKQPVPLPKFFQTPIQTDEIVEIAHRGYSAAAPENTLAALREAKRRGVKIVECDLQVSADDVLVVAHDFKLDNFTNSTGMIIEKSWSEMKWLQVTRGGKTPEPSSPEDSRLIDFDTLMREAKALDLDLIVELRISRDKTDGVVAQFLEIVRRHEMQHRVVMQSFFPNIVWKVKSADPGIYTMQLFLPKPLTKFCRLKVHDQSLLWTSLCLLAPAVDFAAETLVVPISSLVGADSIGMAFPLLTQDTVSGYRASGFAVVAWTVNSESEKRQVASAGVSVLMSDCPGESCASVLSNYL